MAVMQQTPGRPWLTSKELNSCTDFNNFENLLQVLTRREPILHFQQRAKHAVAAALGAPCWPKRPVGGLGRNKHPSLLFCRTGPSG